MKTVGILCLVLAIFATISAFGKSLPDQNTTWEEISQDSRVIYRLPMLQLEGFFIPLNGICISGENLRSKNEVEECLERETNERGDCTRSVSRYVYQAISSTATRCVKWETNERGDCLEYETYTRNIPTSYPTPVYSRVSGGGEMSDWERAAQYPPLFEKDYALRACQ